MKRIMLITLLIIAFSLNAEIINSAFTPELLMPSIINMNNLTINHSMSFSSSISSNSQSAYESVYTNHLNYNFNSKLNLKVDLNFINYGSATYQGGIEFDGNHDNTSKVLPNFQLNYNPSENMSFTIEFRQYNSPFERNGLFD
ncbi:MAG: hypothetical protein P9M11_03270 [Candidatus Tenebribacter burtonii]|jgi:hypothetical protein|nr:hypothetical protein [Candidatus Tenebribacter burtonii]